MSKLIIKKFVVDGVHCKSCKTLIETEVDVLPGVKNVVLNYQTGRAFVEFDDSKISYSEIKDKIESFDYKVIESEEKKKVTTSDHKKKPTSWVAKVMIPVVIFVLIVGYLLIKRYSGFEMLSQLNESNISLWLVLVIGLLASFHCVGMCGGLVVTYSAGIAAKEEKKKPSTFSSPHFQYNFGRLISYTIIGGILGGIGSFFAINPNFSGAVMLIAGFFMILMALSLFTNFKWLEKFQLKMPQSIARFLYSQRHTKKPKGPFIIGLLNGLMPCGPLQAMQLYALGTGSFSRGALSMGIYALGTIPLMFGFGTFISTLSNQYVKKVMKFSAVVVAILGLIMINRGLINFGYGLRGFIPSKAVSQNEYVVTGNIEEYQTVNMELSYRGYEPNVLYVKKDIPVRWVINVKQMSRCTDEIVMPEYNIRKKLQVGENIIEFTPKRLGEIKFSCWMQMVWGKFIVTESDVKPSAQKMQLEAIDLPQGTCSGDGSCGGNCEAAKTGGCGCGAIRSN